MYTSALGGGGYRNRDKVYIHLYRKRPDDDDDNDDDDDDDATHYSVSTYVLANKMSENRNNLEDTQVP